MHRKQLSKLLDFSVKNSRIFLPSQCPPQMSNFSFESRDVIFLLQTMFSAGANVMSVNAHAQRSQRQGLAGGEGIISQMLEPV